MTVLHIKRVANHLYLMSLRYPKCFRHGEKRMLISILAVEDKDMKMDKCEKFIRACWKEHCPEQEMLK